MVEHIVLVVFWSCFQNDVVVKCRSDFGAVSMTMTEWEEQRKQQSSSIEDSVRVEVLSKAKGFKISMTEVSE